MLNRIPSGAKLKRLNRRQRKKLRVGEFQELVFEFRIGFCRPIDGSVYDLLLDAFIEFIESRHLLVAGLGGRLPVLETEGIVSADGRGSPTNDDRQAVLDWFKHRPEVARATVGEYFDGWYEAGEAA